MAPIWSFVTDFGDTAVTIPLALIVAFFLVATKQPRLAIGWCVAIGGCAAMMGALKLALAGCAHPPFGSGLSSPSGHTAMSTAVYGGFAAIVGPTLARPARELLIGTSLALLIGVALSRAILNYHSPVEVVIGLGVGIIALAVILACVHRHRPERLPAFGIALAVVVVALLLHGSRWPAEQVIRHLAAWFGALRPWCG